MWEDAQAFVTKLNARKDGYQYRLPTEAERDGPYSGGTVSDPTGPAGDSPAMPAPVPVLEHLRNSRRFIWTSPVAHPAVLDAKKRKRAEGFHLLPCSSDGLWIEQARRTHVATGGRWQRVDFGYRDFRQRRAPAAASPVPKSSSEAGSGTAAPPPGIGEASSAMASNPVCA